MFVAAPTLLRFLGLDANVVHVGTVHSKVGVVILQDRIMLVADWRRRGGLAMMALRHRFNLIIIIIIHVCNNNTGIAFIIVQAGSFIRTCTFLRAGPYRCPIPLILVKKFLQVLIGVQKPLFW